MIVGFGVVGFMMSPLQFPTKGVPVGKYRMFDPDRMERLTDPDDLRGVGDDEVIQEMRDELKEQTSRMDEQIDFAKSEAEQARKEARRSFIVAVVSSAVALLALAWSIVSDFI